MNFVIERVSLRNFRGYKETTLDLFPNSEEKRGIVLIGGANGFGKTSIIDAVEWCLTGTIKRLKQEFELRGEQNTLALQLGLLRNAGTNDPVSVTVEAKYQGRSITITRSFDGKAEKDGLNPEKTNLEINTGGNSLIAKTIDELQGFKPISNVFYERFICSYEKNIAIYEKSRTDIYHLFSSFFGGIDEIDNIIFSLEGVDRNKKSHVNLLAQASERVREAEKKREYIIKEINDITSKVADLTTALVKNEEVSNALTEYASKIPLYKEDGISIRDWNTDNSIDEKAAKFNNNRRTLERIRQLSKRFRGFLLAKDYLVQLSALLKADELNNELIQPYHRLKPLIVKARFLNEQSLFEIKGLAEQHKEGISSLTSTDIDIFERIFKEFIDGKSNEDKILADELVKWKKCIQDEAGLLTELAKYESFEPVVNSLRALVDNVDGFSEYRAGGATKCPLCGSLDFSLSLELASEAKKVLGTMDGEREIAQNKLKLQRNETKEHFELIKRHMNTILEEIISEKREALQAINSTRNFKISCQKYAVSFENITDEIVEQLWHGMKTSYDMDEFGRLEKELLLSLESDNLIEGITSRISEDWVSANEFINWSYKEKSEQVEKFLADYSNDEIHGDLLIGLDQITQEDVDCRISLLLLLENELTNNIKLKLANESLSAAKLKLEEAQKDINSKQLYFDWFKEKANNIKSIKNEWDKKIAAELNGPIQTIYRRLNRHSNFYEIDFKREGRTNPLASLGVQSKDKNLGVANVLSAGQLSTVALSVFFTVAFSQWRDNFRCYFMDDPIQSMDDLNVLSFVDLLRIELGPQRPHDKRFADQLFLTTCNEDLENLILYKMKSFGINICHVKLKGYGSRM
jgi:uncharacterized Zn finger protein (UPF0148 family)